MTMTGLRPNPSERASADRLRPPPPSRVGCRARSRSQASLSPTVLAWVLLRQQPPGPSVDIGSARHEGVAWLEVDIDTDPKRLRRLLLHRSKKRAGDIEVRRVKPTLKGEPVATAA